MSRFYLLIGWLALRMLSITATKHRFDNCIYASDECPNEDIQFWLYTNVTHATPTAINPLDLTAAQFQPKLPIKLLIHGFLGHRNNAPNSELRDPLLQTQNTYVISVDYGRLVELPCYYPWSIHNARVVGKCVALLVDNLIEQQQYERSDIHIIGFSLGAQVAGYAANYVNHTLSHITALDPARIGFVDVADDDKLDTNDADFIDVIHTDPYFFALLDSVGHADFYVNFPNPIQPGCTFWRNRRFYNCNHFRASIYYAESITTTESFWAQNCGSWSNYMLQRCENYRNVPNAAMGYFVTTSASGSYFLSTNAEKPFAKGLKGLTSINEITSSVKEHV